MGCVIGQRIRFERAREIRRQLGTGEWTLEQLMEAPWSTFHLSTTTIATIRTILGLAKQSKLETNWESIKGVGRWTVKAVKLIRNDDPTIWLWEDKWVIQRMRDYLQCPSGDVKTWMALYPGVPRDASMFFWRIRPEGIVHIHQGKDLTRDDFL